MKKNSTYITLFFVIVLTLLLPSIKEKTSYALDTIELNKVDNNQASIKQTKQDPIPFEITDGKPFLKIETSRENKQHLTKRTLLRKTTTSFHEAERNITCNWVVTQYLNNKHNSILRKNNYYLYALCRIII